MTETENCKVMSCDRDAQHDGYCRTCHALDCDGDASGDRICSLECNPCPSGSNLSKADLRGYCARDGCDNPRGAGMEICTQCENAKYGNYSGCARAGCDNPARPGTMTYCTDHSPTLNS